MQRPPCCWPAFWFGPWSTLFSVMGIKSAANSWLDMPSVFSSHADVSKNFNFALSWPRSESVLQLFVVHPVPPVQPSHIHRQ